MLEAIQHYYEQDNANIHRGVHTLAERATSAYEAAREKLRRFFINAASTKEVLFTRGTTTGLNWVAVGFGDLIVEEGDEIYITPIDTIPMWFLGNSWRNARRPNWSTCR